MVHAHLEEANSVEAAIENALKKLNVTRKEVEIEIVQEPAKGLLGLGKKRAIVRLTVKKEEKKTQKTYGTLGVFEGQLQYQAPSTDGVPPSLRFSHDFRVEYQGHRVMNRLVLDEGLESLSIELPENQEPKLEYEVKIDKNKLKAELFWKRTPGIHYKLGEQEPTNQLNLSLEKDFIEAPRLTPPEVEEILTIEGISFGVDLSAITQELLSQPSGLVTIAQGTPAQPGQRPTITYVFQEDSPQIDLDALRIDHYEVHGIRSVEPGALLAVKTPGQPGVPGRDVFGNEIKVEPLKDLPLEVGEGASLSEDGLQARAEIAGLPTFTGKVVTVQSAFELNGDADVSTGNITMDGAIIIRGNVLESVKVESKNGSIVVNGLVSGALLRTAGSITVVKNVLRSQLYAGGHTVIKIRQVGMLHSIGSQLEQLLQAHAAIVKQADAVPFENLIKHLLELKFFDLPKEVASFAAYIDEVVEQTSLELVALKDNLVSTLLGTGPFHIKDISILQRLFSLLRSQELILEKETDTTSNATVGYLQNSRVEASGEVEITGTGCYYSTVVGGHGFKMPNGVFRGGEVTVNSGNIIAKEFGGPTGVATEAHIIKEGRITANRVYPNVTVSLGDQHFKFGEEASQVKVFLSEGNLAVYSGSLQLNE